MRSPATTSGLLPLWVNPAAFRLAAVTKSEIPTAAAAGVPTDPMLNHPNNVARHHLRDRSASLVAVRGAQSWRRTLTGDPKDGLTAV
jgi:hypothetical protein